MPAPQLATCCHVLQASCDVSGLPIEGPDADSRIQGGLLADGVNSFLACLMTCHSDGKVAGKWMVYCNWDSRD